MMKRLSSSGQLLREDIETIDWTIVWNFSPGLQVALQNLNFEQNSHSKPDKNLNIWAQSTPKLKQYLPLINYRSNKI